MMQRYNVRCCCQPTKILGTLQLRAGLRHMQEVPVFERPTTRACEIGSAALPPTVPLKHRRITMRAFGSNVTEALGSTEIAVYSDDRPIEFWRKLRGFEEARA